MKQLKTLLFACLTILWLSAPAFSQPRENDAPTRAAKLTEIMKTSLGLTDDQLPKVQEINLRYGQQVDDMRASATMNYDDKKAKFKSLLDAKDAELKTVFTEEQYQSYQVKKKEMEKRLKERMKERNKAGVY